MSDQTRDPKTPKDFMDPAAWLYLPEAVARELHECARSNGRIDIDYLVAIYRCGREAARAADAQTIAALQDENARLKAEVNMLREHNGRMLRNRYEETNQELRRRVADCEAELATLKADADRREREAGEALDELSSAADDIETIAQGIHTRLMSDDVPWSVASEVDGEFSLEFERVEKRLKQVHRTLTQALTQRQEQSKP